MEANQVLIDLVKKVAEEKNVTPAQISLAWVLAQKPCIVPILGTPKLIRLEENIASKEVKFKKEELSKLNETLFKIKVYGDRYPAGSDYARRVGK